MSRAKPKTPNQNFFLDEKTGSEKKLLMPLCAKPVQRPPLADVRLVHAQRGDTYEPSDVRFFRSEYGEKKE